MNVPTPSFPPSAPYPQLALRIGGRAVAGGAPAAGRVMNPATGQPLAELPGASSDDLDAAVAAAQAAFGPWSRTDAYARSRILERAADLLRERVEAIAAIMTLEQGKPLGEARGEVLHGADVIEWYAEEGRRAYGRIIPARGPHSMNFVAPEPVGVAAAFTPWNFPALTPCRKIGGALAAGCALVLKPAEETPGVALAIADAFTDAGLPPGALNVVFGAPAEVSGRLIANPAVRKVSFTGSTAIGRQLMALCAPDLKRTTMELGGHAPVLVFDDADIAAAVRGLVGAKYRNAGQVCIAPTRFYVHRPVFQRFVDAFAEAASALKVADGRAPGAQMGPLANPRRLEATSRLVADARRKGAACVAGGEAMGGDGWFFQPTVLVGAPDAAEAMTEEPFGPLALINAFDEPEAAIQAANRLPFGLAGYVFTRATDRALATARGLRCGMVGVNSVAISTPESPFGGVGHSGHGQEGGLEGLSAYQDLKAVALSYD